VSSEFQVKRSFASPMGWPGLRSATHAPSILGDFVNLSEIEPLFFRTAYYLAPRRIRGQRPTSPRGNPAKVAQDVLEVAAIGDHPLRLILGSEAYAYAMAAAAARSVADETWHNLTVSTDRKDATAAERDPLGTLGG
jgi:hypothetical protein